MAKSDRDAREFEAETLLYPGLEALIELIDESAAIVYPRALHRRHLTRLLVFLIGLADRMTSRDLILATGYEKAQISRGLKELAEAGLIDRPELRGCISLNAAGQELFAQIMLIASERDAKLREGISQDEIQRFLDMTATLIERTSRLVAPEELDDEGSGTEQGQWAPTSIVAPSRNDLVQPALRRLMVHIRRSGTSLFRREVGLSHLEWRVLSLIAETRQINLSTLIPLTGRDKSQVARAVKQLHANGLIDRHDEARANVALTLSRAGAARQAHIRAIGARHDALIFADFHATQRAFYLDVVQRLGANGKLLLSETAAEEEPAVQSRLAPGQCEDRLERLRQENDRLRRQLAEARAELAVLRDAHPLREGS